MKIKRSNLGQTLREVRVETGLPEPDVLAAEFEGYMDVLMGRVPPPAEMGTLTLMEVADAYFARACEVQFLILKGERNGDVFKGSKLYKFRTGELRAFMDLSKKAAELGSRRLTQEKMEFDMLREAQDIGGSDER